MADQFTAGETFTEDEQVTATKLNLAQTNLKFTTNAVDGSTTDISSEAIIVKSGGITATQLATDAVIEAKISDGAVTNAKLGADSVNGSKIADNAIDSEHYTDASIDSEHLAASLISGQSAALSAVPHLTQDEILISDNGALKKFALMKHLPLPRAYGLIKMDGSPDTSDPISLYGCSCTAYSSGTYTFDLSAAMANANYTVITQVHNTTYYDDDSKTPAVELVDADTFKIHIFVGGDASYYTSRHVSFAVFGTLA
tara:strand:+ start:340 stop:1107 length:768 start_codon:yes stop_codon:yes gene_type:complete